MAGKYVLAGAYRMWIAKKTLAGYPMGQLANPEAPVNNTVYAPYIVEGFVSVGAPTQSYDKITRRVGQRVTGSAVLGVSDYGSFPLTLSDYDETFHALISDTSLDTTLATAVTISAANFGQTDFPRFVVGFVGGGLDDDGNTVRVTAIYNNVQITKVMPTISEVSGEVTNSNPLEYTVDVSLSTRTGLGYLYSATSLAVQDNEDGAIILRHPTYGYLINTYIDDGIDTGIFMSHKPTVSEHAGATNIFTKNGVTAHASVGGVNVSTSELTITAGTAADIWVMTFATDFVAT